MIDRILSSAGRREPGAAGLAVRPQPRSGNARQRADARAGHAWPPDQADHYSLEVTGPAQVIVSFTGPPTRIRELRGMLQRNELHVDVVLTVPEERLQREPLFRHRPHRGDRRPRAAGRHADRRRGPQSHPGDAAPPGRAARCRCASTHAAGRAGRPGRHRAGRRCWCAGRRRCSTASAPSRRSRRSCRPGRPTRRRRRRRRPRRRWCRSWKAGRSASTPTKRDGAAAGRSRARSTSCPTCRSISSARPNFPLRPQFFDDRAGRVTLRVHGPTQDEPPKVYAFIDLTHGRFASGRNHEPLQIQLPKDFQLVAGPAARRDVRAACRRTSSPRASDSSPP